MYEKTMVGWDGSASARAAVDWAVRRVEGRSRAVRIVRVVDSVALDADDLDTRWAVAVATFALAEVAARLRVGHPEMDVTTAVALGEPADVLNEHADGDSLIVVGTQHGHIDEYWFSSRLGARLAAVAGGAVAGIGGFDERPSVGLFAAEVAHLRSEELHLVYTCPEHTAGSEAAFGHSDEAAFDRTRCPQYPAHFRHWSCIATSSTHLRRPPSSFEHATRPSSSSERAVHVSPGDCFWAPSATRSSTTPPVQRSSCQRARTDRCD